MYSMYFFISIIAKKRSYMDEKYTTYVIKSIPRETWRMFKMRFLQDGFDTCNEALLHIVTKYSNGELNAKETER